MSLPTFQEMVNLYLYGQVTPNPSAPERPENVHSSINIDTEEYMQGVAWYAVPAQFYIVRDFFNAPAGTFQTNKDYDFAEMKAALENVYPNRTYTEKWNTKQYLWNDDVGGIRDLFERAFIYNSSQFKLGADTRFSVDSSGVLSLKNWSVIPDPGSQDNFDFESEDPFAIAANLILEPIVDLKGIGRTVDFNFINPTPPHTTPYSQNDFNNDYYTNMPSWGYANSNASNQQFLSLIDGLQGDYDWLLNAIPASPGTLSPIPFSLIPLAVNGSTDLYGKGPKGLSPLVLDLDGDGIEVSQLGYGATGSHTYFDMNNDGFADRTAWSYGGDGLLAIDRNGNGKIDNQSELFGNYGSYTEGFANLKQYDSNNDNKITSADTQFSNLRVWVDADNDGITDAGELRTLSSLQITEISLAKQGATNSYLNGNYVSGQSTFVMNGGSKNISDVWFVNDVRDSKFLGDYTLDIKALFLPTLKGFGGLKDLHVAMSLDSGLLSMVQNFVNNWSPSKFGSAGLLTEVQEILFKWAGVENFHLDITLGRIYDTFASPYDSRIVAFMQVMTGNPYTTAQLASQPIEQMYMTLFAFSELTYFFRSQLILQVDADTLFNDLPHFNLATGEMDHEGSLSQSAISALAPLAAASGHINDYWREVITTLFSVKEPEQYSTQEIQWIKNALTASGASTTWEQYIDLVLNNSYGSSLLQGRSIGWNGGDNPYRDVHLVGSNGGDIIQGGSGNDFLEGRGSGDWLKGEPGNDILDGGRGDDILDGGADIDTATYDSAHLGVTVNLSITTAQNTIGAGVDTLISIENLQGTAYNDVLIGDSKSNTIEGGLGADVINGGGGIDLASYASASSAVIVNLASTTSQNTGVTGSDTLIAIEGIIGSVYNDTLTGDGNANIIEGGAGNDILNGAGGSDTVSYTSATGSVTINLVTTTAQNTGGGGTDTLTSFENIIGSAYNDTLIGDGNANIIEGGDGNDALNGAGGIDTASYASAKSGVTVDLAVTTTQNTLGAGTDTLTSFENLLGSAYGDNLTGDGNANIIDGGDGNDALNGAGGIDTLSYASAASGVTVSFLINGMQNTVGAGYDYIQGFENILGSAFNDFLTGDANANTITGGDGNDFIQGGLGNDILIGGNGIDTAWYSSSTSGVNISLTLTGAQNTIGAGFDTLSNFENILGSAYNDMLFGDANANTIEGGEGDDVMDGAGGVDTISYMYSAGVTVNLALTTAQNTIGAGTDTLTSFENIIGSGYNDTLTGDGNANIIEGGAGNDILNGAGGIDTVSYASATYGVTVALAYTTAQNTSGAGTDTLSNFENILGSGYNDNLYGDANANTLIGGLGADMLMGASGADTFKFLSSGLDGNFDRIADFSTAQGDKIDLKDLLFGYDPITKAITDFVEFTTDGANTVVKIDRDGTGTTYGWQQIAQLDNVTGLTDEAALKASGNLIVV